MEYTAVDKPSTSRGNISQIPSKEDSESMETVFEKLEDVFSNLDFASLDCISSTLECLPTNSPKTMDVVNESSLPNQHICRKELGGEIYLTCELFRGHVKIHIRKFVQESKFHPFIATKTGLCLTLKTWYRMYQKIQNFNLIYTSSSFVANNSLLVLNQDGEMILQDMKSMQRIALDYFQLQRLKEISHEFNDLVLTFLFENYLPELIALKLPPSENCQEENVVLDSRIISIIENNLSQIFRKEFECQGCISDCGGQLRHECMTLRELEKYQRLGEFILILVDFNEIVDIFVRDTKTVSASFLNNFNVKIISDVPYKTPSDI